MIEALLISVDQALLRTTIIRMNWSLLSWCNSNHKRLVSLHYALRQRVVIVSGCYRSWEFVSLTIQVFLNVSLRHFRLLSLRLLLNYNLIGSLWLLLLLVAVKGLVFFIVFIRELSVEVSSSIYICIVHGKKTIILFHLLNCGVDTQHSLISSVWLNRILDTDSSKALRELLTRWM